MAHQSVSGMDRTEEWFVPRFGPRRFRVLVGLLFLPYTGMVLSFTVLGALLAPRTDWERVGALLVIYGLALGVAAHALDALGSRDAKPWGTVFRPTTLKIMAAFALLGAYAIGAWYMQRYAPWLWIVALAEGFFLLAYNLEWFGGWFHSDGWFAFSWGALPAIAGFMLQTNRLSIAVLVLGAGTAALSLVEIKASRPYKLQKRLARAGRAIDAAQVHTLEAILKAVSLGTIALTAGVALARAFTASP